LEGLYYFAKRTYHFSQSKSIFEKLGGKIITTTEFPLTFFYFLFKYGPFRIKIMSRKLFRLHRVARGLILCHSADGSVPRSDNYKRVFVYHGTSDKVFTMPDKKLRLEWFEYYFLSGEKDRYKLKHFSHRSDKLDHKIVKIGMFRSDPVFKNNYSKEKILRRYKIQTNAKKIILYAPTWNTCFERFAEEITKEYVLIIRPHANDRRNIKYILTWMKKNKKQNLYFFPKQYQDIMNFIYISDLMIGDHSAVNYDFALTGRPMVFVKSDTVDVFIPPDKYNVRLCGPLYDPEKDDIIEKIEDAFNNPTYEKKMIHLIRNSFYYNDGHAVDRACSFIVDKLSEMGMIDKQFTLKKYGRYFTYMNNYK